MKRFAILLTTLFFTSVLARAVETYGKTFSPDTRQIALSTNPATASQICVNDAFIYRTWIVNTSTMSVFISTSMAMNSITTSFAIPGASSTTASYVTGAVIWSPDGPAISYSGPLFASSNPGGAQNTISVFRMK